MVSGTLLCPPWHGSRMGQSWGGCRTVPSRASPCQAAPRHAEPRQSLRGVRGARASVRARRVGTACAGGPGRARGCESAGGRCGERRPWPRQPPGTPRASPAPPPSKGGGGVCFFYSLFHSFQKRLVLESSAPCPAQPPGTPPAPRPAAGSPGTAGAGGAPGWRPVGGVARELLRDPWAQRGTAGGSRWVPARGWAASGSQDRGRARPCPRPTRPLRPGVGPGRPAQEGTSCLKPHPRHSSQRHPGGISRGAWAGLESKASLPAPAGRPASPGSSAPCRAEPCRAAGGRAATASPARVGTHMDPGSGATQPGAADAPPALPWLSPGRWPPALMFPP